MAKEDKGENAFDEVRFTSELEQFEATLINSAPLVQSYFEALTKNGLSNEFAYQLTRDWHRIFWERVMKNATSG
ncbi:MAG: hypothetical protein ACFE9A_20945 [Candidatus Hodarchaeota archaeon]